ncbi:MAG: hypothetical protein AAFY21_00420 [Cyanobacteria bacterium J06641_2]
MVSDIGTPNNDFVLNQDLVIKDSNGLERIRLDHQTGGIVVKNDSREMVFRWGLEDNTLRFGGHGKDSNLAIFPKSVTNFANDGSTFYFDSQQGNLFLGGGEIPGQLVCKDDRNNQTILLNGISGNIIIGANGKNGNLALQNSENKPTIKVNGENANISVGGQGTSGQIILRDGNRQNRVLLDASNQRLEIRDDSGDIISMMGGDANVRVGTNGRSGNAYFYPARATNIFDNSQATIHLNGDSGDIILQNADCAEDFEVEILETSEPGTVMVISDSSRLRVSNQAYDCRVAGIVAGAGQYRPGIILGRNKDAKNSLPIALMGRVTCKVDASNSPIRVGDLLTTSSVPGHAMKVTDPEKAFGTVIGKALGELNSGTGMIPVLVALQ